MKVKIKDLYKDCPCQTCVNKPCQFWDDNRKCTTYREWERKNPNKI